jgi:RNA polymerase sigma-70 factor (ECF subfamily)
VLRRVAAGETEAFADLVERHQGTLLRLCERMLGDAEEARDAAQEVFLKAYRKAAGFQPRARVSTWLYRIATNHCLNRIRRRKVVRMISFGGASEEADPGLDPPDREPDALERLDARRRWRSTRQAIDALPVNQRAVVVLAKFEGLSYRRIARVLGITVGAVESRLFRAMRNLERAQERAGPGVAPKGESSDE